MTSIRSMIQVGVDNMYYRCTKDMSKMLIHTGAIGWAASSAAHIIGISMNDKISLNKKKFLIPQETLDAASNIGLYYMLTHLCDLIAKKMCDLGKIRTPFINESLEARAKQLGCKVEDLFKGKYNTKISFENVLKFDPKLHAHFKNLRGGLSIATSLIGGIISCNLLTPPIRNYIGSIFQAKNLDKSQPTYK